jgi:hypothetical protein
MIVRQAGVVAGTLYAFLCMLVVVVVAGEGQGDAPFAAALVAVPLASAVLYLSALVWRDGRHRQARGLIGWFGMVLGMLPLISFSFVVGPLLVVALPTLVLTPAAGGSR